jgi:hypothetical protein
MKAGRRRVNVFDGDEVALEQLLTNADPKIVLASKTAATRWRSEYNNAFNEELVTSQMGRSSPEQPPLKTGTAGTASTTPGSRSNREKLQTFETTRSRVEGWGKPAAPPDGRWRRGCRLRFYFITTHLGA